MPFIYAFVLSKINKRAVLDTGDKGQRPSHLLFLLFSGLEGYVAQGGRPVRIRSECRHQRAAEAQVFLMKDTEFQNLPPGQNQMNLVPLLIKLQVITEIQSKDACREDGQREPGRMTLVSLLLSSVS